MYYAHSKNYHGQRHSLIEHLRGVAFKSAKFASPFAAGKLAYYLGLWHDLGKFNPAFQQYLENCEQNSNSVIRGPDRKAAGTQLAMKNELGLASLIIHGHHGGLVKPADCLNWLKEKANNPATS